MRIVAAALFLATTLSGGAVLAAPKDAPLKPGQPAGVQQAQMQGNTVMAVGALGILGLGIGLAASGDSNQVTSTSTSSTGTTP